MNAKARGARHDPHALRRPDRPVAGERVDGERPREDGARPRPSYPLIREFSRTPSHVVEVQPTGRMLGLQQHATASCKRGQWDIQLQKTGYIREAGRCLVMLAQIASKPIVIVLLDSVGKYTRMGDAKRVKHWLETGQGLPVAKATIAAAGKTRKPGKSSARPVAAVASATRR